MNAPKGTFVPKLWADKILQNLQHTSVLIDEMPAAFSTEMWEVWFAWWPVKIAIVTRHEMIHDEIIVEGYTRWRWLVHVARRPARVLTWVKRHRKYPWFKPYDYGPATNALTQPKALLGRLFGHGK